MLVSNKAQSRLILLLLFITILGIVFVSAQTAGVIPGKERKAAILAKVHNEDSLTFDKNYRQQYLKENKNFSKLHYHNITQKNSFNLKVGAKRDTVRGVDIQDKKYAIDLLYCNPYQKYCTFRINGVPTERVYFDQSGKSNMKKSFRFEDKHELSLENTIFNTCDNKRFCHLGYEGYHEVDVAINKHR